MYIKTLVLENFQAHEKSTFKLDKGLNVLVGVSNSGKSSISRALQFVLMGSPWDKSWVRFGAKFCRITIETDNDIQVIREKGDKVNRYILVLPNQESKTYDSFGTQVPEEIQQVLKIQEVQVDSTDKLNLNLAGQMDSLFLLAQTGSFGAKVLGKLSGATYLDYAIRELNKNKRQITAEKAAKEQEFEELKIQVDKILPIEGYKTQIEEIEARITSVSTQETRVERIRELFKRVKVLKEAWTKEKAKAALLEQIDLTPIQQLSTKVDKIKALSLFYSRFADFQSAFRKNNKLQVLLASIDLSNLTRLVEKSDLLRKVRDSASKINRNQIDLASKAAELKQVEHRHDEATKEYSDKLKAAGICPLCNASTVNV